MELDIEELKETIRKHNMVLLLKKMKENKKVNFENTLNIKNEENIVENKENTNEKENKDEEEEKEKEKENKDEEKENKDNIDMKKIILKKRRKNKIF